MEKEPMLVPIKNGWAAFGDDWAVHGATQEEAIEKYWKAVERHREIDARPLWYERFGVQSAQGSQHDRSEEIQTRQEIESCTSHF